MTTLRLSVVHAAAFALAIGQHGQAQAQGGGAAQQIEIVAQPLASAIARLNEITGAQIVAPADLVAGRTSAAIDSVMTPEEALAALIAGAPLDIETTPAGSYILISSTVDEEGALTEPDITTLQTIVVTARRTEEALVDVPGSVAVFSGDDIDRSNLTDTDDLTLLTPNAQFSGNDNPARIFFSIRGISDLNVASTGPTIGFFQDGVLQNSTGLVINSNRRVVDVERVEVLYGPQGTAFGRGTIGG
ncbi:MAG: TonB-dependent receptor plug domain-containing protein, partial [Pseudomonadota bacterium]